MAKYLSTLTLLLSITIIAAWHCRENPTTTTPPPSSETTQPSTISTTPPTSTSSDSSTSSESSTSSGSSTSSTSSTTVPPPQPGQNERPTYFAPFVAAIYTDNERRCSAAIIDRRFVVTTAHCCHFQISTNRSVVKVGATDLTQNTTVVGINMMFPNRDYDPEEETNDICVIKLASKLKWSNNVQQFKLPERSLPDNDTALLYTWKNPSMPQGQLKQLQVHHYPHYKCRENITYPDIDDSMLCGSIGADDKNGIGVLETGAPLQIHGYLYGLASANLDWTYSPAPITIYTDIYNFRDYIIEIIHNHFY